VSFALVAIAVIALIAVAFLIMRPRSSREAPSPAPAAPTPAAAAEPPSRTETPAARVEQPPPKPAAKPPAAPATGAVTLATAQVCRNFSTAGSNWRCDQVQDSTSPGPLVLYTRVRSASDDVVVHRWFRGNVLRQSVQLRIRANPTEGYRTYSRQTVDAGEWRVEVRNASGDVLQDQRFAVR
jgi:type IV secretory pathway VirB10-like protein